LDDAERAVRLAQTAEDKALEATALNALGRIVGMSRSAVEGIELLELARERASSSNVPSQAAVADLNLAYLANASGDPAGAESHTRRGLELEGVYPATVAMLRANRGLARACAGDLDGALALQLAAIRTAGLAGSRACARRAVACLHLYLARRTCRGQAPSPKRSR